MTKLLTLLLFITPILAAVAIVAGFVYEPDLMILLMLVAMVCAFEFLLFTVAVTIANPREK
jgi:hypothetical protein